MARRGSAPGVDRLTCVRASSDLARCSAANPAATVSKVSSGARARVRPASGGRDRRAGAANLAATAGVSDDALAAARLRRAAARPSPPTASAAAQHAATRCAARQPLGQRHRRRRRRPAPVRATATVGTHHCAALNQSSVHQALRSVSGTLRSSSSSQTAACAVGGRAPVAARRQRAAGRDLRPVRQGRALELAGLEKAVQEHPQPAA